MTDDYKILEEITSWMEIQEKINKLIAAQFRDIETQLNELKNPSKKYRCKGCNTELIGDVNWCSTKCIPLL